MISDDMNLAGYILASLASVFIAVNIISNPTGTGRANGQIVNVAVGGILVDSCEVVIQKGESSSNSIQLSHKDTNYCAKFVDKIGKEITFEYKMVKFSPFTTTNTLITGEK